MVTETIAGTGLHQREPVRVAVRHPTIVAAEAYRDAIHLQERVLRDAGHLIENALRNARIANVDGTGILHRTPPPYRQAVEEVQAAVVKARHDIGIFLLDRPYPVG